MPDYIFKHPHPFIINIPKMKKKTQIHLFRENFFMYPAKIKPMNV